MKPQKTTFKQTEIGMIPEEWEEVVLSDVIEINPQRKLKKGELAKFVSMADINPFQRKISNFTIKEFKGGSKFQNGDTLFARITPCLENGKTCFVDILDDKEVAFGSTEFIVLSAKEGKTVPLFVYYLSRSPEVRNSAIKSMSGTSGRQRVESEVFDTIFINLPPLPEQRAIAKILSDLDARIELNQQMNKTLEAIGQALFKHWFVDFEFPCLPKSYDFGAGKPADFDSICTYKAVGGLPVPDGKKWFVYVLLCKNESFYIGITNDLYRRWYEHKKGIGAKWTKANEPIKVIHYEEYNSQAEAAKREKELKTGFGRKWLKREYNKYLKLKQGLPACNAQAGLPACNAQAGLPAPECKLRQAGRMVYNEELGKEIPEGWRVGRLKDISENFDSKRIPLSSREREKRKGIYPYYGATGILDFIDDYIFDGIYLLMGEDGSVVDDKGFPILQYVFGKFWVNNHAHVLKGKRISTEMLYLLLKNTNVSHIVTGAVQPKINQENMNKLKFAIPQEDDLIEKLKMVISIIFDRISQNQQQSLTLSRIRDALLPRLMSGKIRVPVDEMVNGENL